MRHIIKSIILLAAILIGGAGQAWAMRLSSVSRGVITGGSIAFYSDEACTTEFTGNVSTVYIKAKPSYGYKGEVASEGEKVDFIKAEVVVSSGQAQARTRGDGTTIGVGDFIDVTATATRGVYCITMPTDNNLDVRVTATFIENQPISVSYIDANGEPQQTNAYELDGTEFELGNTSSTADSPKESWYVCKKNLSYTNLGYFKYGSVNIILADGVEMKVENSNNFDIADNLGIYGQSAGTGVFTATSSGAWGIMFAGKIIISHCKVRAEGTLTGISAQSITISGADVTAVATTGEYVAEGIDGTGIAAEAITITGSKVRAEGSTGIFSKADIVLDWTNTTDFIYASSYKVSDGKAVKIADGKRFIAYSVDNTNPESPVESPAAIIPSGDISDLATINGKTLRPCTDYFVKTVEGVTASATGGKSITIGTETLYKVASGAELTLRATDSDKKKLSSVTLTGATATGSDGTFTFTMPTSDVTVTAAAFLEQVTYYDPTAVGDDKTKTVYATPLTGSETTLAPGWYVVNKDVDYTTVNDYNVLKATGDVNLILADGKTMNIGSEENPVTGRGIYSAALAIYGQGGTTEGSLKIYTGTYYSIQGKGDITIYGGNLTVGRTLSTDGKFTIHGGTFTDARTTNDNDDTAISAAEINIRGGRVTSVGKLYGSTGDINISGGIVDVYCLSAYNGSIAISGGQVTLTIAKNHAISSKNGITLGWTNVTDFISVTSEGKFHSAGNLTINAGKGFLAISDDNTGAYYDSNSNSTFKKDSNGNFSVLTGKTLRPALKVTMPAGFTATGTDVVTHETAGTYAIDGATVTINSSNYSAPAGQTFNGFTVKDADNNEVSVTNGAFTMPATAVTVTAILENIVATAPSITAQPAGLSLSYGYPSGSTLSVTASAADGHALSYQWYSSSSSSASGTAISGATAASYDVPTGLSVGSTYYYCVVTATRRDNSETATATSSVATVTVSARTVESASGVTITQDENGYTATINEESGDAAVISSSILNSNGEVTIASLTYNRTLTAPTGTSKVTIDNQAANLYTTCMPTAPTTGGGKKYYSLSGADGTTLSFTEVALPAAKTPYLVAVFAGSNATESSSGSGITLSKEVSGSSADGYVLKGTLTGLSNADARGKYILQSGGTWGQVVSGSVIISPFRAYIEATGAGARLLESSFGDDATGIRSMRTIDRDGTERWYDLQGRRIDKPVQQGVYIHNGRKEVRR